MEQVKLGEFNLKGMKSAEDLSTTSTYVLIQSFIKQLTLPVKQCFFHACNKSDHLQLRPEAAIILQFFRCRGSVTSWNIRLLKNISIFWGAYSRAALTSKLSEIIKE